MLSTSWSCSAALCATSQCADLSTASPTDCPKSSLKFENSPTTKNRHTLAVYAQPSCTSRRSRAFDIDGRGRGVGQQLRSFRKLLLPVHDVCHLIDHVVVPIENVAGCLHGVA